MARGHTHGGVAVGLQHPAQGRPVAVIALLFEGIGDPAQQLIRQDREKNENILSGSGRPAYPPPIST